MGQEEAIRKTKGPCVVLAGAGTGKTYTIVEKIKYLIDNKIYPPEKIVCITFSNEAANNLMNRISRAVSFEEGKEPVIKTFHSFSADLLRKYGERIGIRKDFRVLTPDEAKVVLHKYFKVPPMNCHKYVSSIGMAKDLGIDLDLLKDYVGRKSREFGDVDLERRLESLRFEIQTLYLRKNGDKRRISREIRRIDSLLKIRKFANAWGAYEKIKNLRNYQDYSDLNNNSLKLLKENRDICNDYDYIIVDEFQDTNKIQLDLLFCLAPHRNITVVGDLNQSIYRFRGAYNENFKEFKEGFNVSDQDVFNLDRSFRSSNKILKTAHRLILNNYSNSSDCFEVLNAFNVGGDNVEVYEMKNGREEARKVVELVEEELRKGTNMNDICIMFRTHQQGRVIKKALGFKGLPYVSVRKESLLKEKSIRTVIDYLSILERIKRKRGGGQRAWWDLVYNLNFSGNDLIKIGRFIKDNKGSENFSSLMMQSLPELDLSDSGKMGVKVLLQRINLLIGELDKDVPELIKSVFSIGGLISNEEGKRAVTLNLNRFFDLSKDHFGLYGGDLSGFIHYLRILEDLGVGIEAADSEGNGIRLMTSHSTKGLEYKTVIVTNLAQKRFPIENTRSNPLIPIELSPEFKTNNFSDFDVEYQAMEYERKNQLFEERRLCYVSFTRAKERLILTYAKEYGGKKYFPSQFLNEIRYKDNEDLSYISDMSERYKESESRLENGADFLNTGNLGDAEIRKDDGSMKITFSPSALLTFDQCQKKYEYRYVYNMPEQKVVSWEAIMLGSFVHKVLDEGVKKGFVDLRDFELLAREMSLEEDWEEIDLSEALFLIRVFFERNKGRYNSESKTEQVLKAEIAGMNFIGFADRIDFGSDGVGIVDYKTGKSSIPPKAREWQMGYYALAASKFGKVKRITLDMLRHDKPLEFELDDKGNAVAVNSDRMEGFNIYAVEEELIKTAHAVLSAYEDGFKPCPVDSNCEFCNEWVWEF